MDRSHKQKTNKETMALNDTLDQMDLTDIFRTFHPKAAEYTFFSTAHGTFSRIDHILGHKWALNKYKKTETIPCIFSDHNTMKLEINHKKKFGKIGGKTTNTWRLKNIPLKYEFLLHGLAMELKRKVKSTWKPMKMKHDSPNPLGCSKGFHKRKIHCNPGLFQETRKILNFS